MKLATDKSFQHSHAKQLAGFLCCLLLPTLPLFTSHPVLRFYPGTTTKGGNKRKRKRNENENENSPRVGAEGRS